MSYRLSNDPDPPVLRDAWEYLERCGIAREDRGCYFADFELADLFFRLVGPDPERVRGALRLQELVERYAAKIRELNETDTASLDIFPPTAEEDWEIADSSLMVFSSCVRGATLPEAVEAALKELDDD